MNIKTHMVLPIVMLLSTPVIAADNAEQGPAKPTAELRLFNSLNLSGSLTANTGTQPATTSVVDKVEAYQPQTDKAAPQQ